MPPEWACVAAGGALGTLARAGLDSAAAARPVGGLFAPWSVLVANVVGALALGALAAFTAARSAAFPERARALARLKLFAGTGFAGAFTGFASFVDPTGKDTSSAVNFWIASFVALAVAFVCTYFFGFKEDDFGQGRTVEKVRLGNREAAKKE